MFTLSTPALLLAAGLAFDFANVSMLRAQLQAAADSAAIAGAKQLSISGAKQSTINSAVAAFLAQHSDGRFGAIKHTVKTDSKLGEVHVDVEQQWQPVFGQYFMSDMTPVRIAATARLVEGASKICVLSLMEFSPNNIFIQMSGRIHAHGCGLYANSESPFAIHLSKDAEVKADLICAAGGVSRMSGSSVSPEPVTDCPRVEDPLKGRAAPAVGACDENDFAIGTGDVDLKPGVYCGGLRIGGDARVTFLEGEYIIKDGPLVITDSAAIKGQYVGFYFTGWNSVLNISSSGTVDLTGPRDGTMAGLLFQEDAAAPGIRIHMVRGKDVRRLEGTIYLPKGSLLIDPDAAVAEESAYTAIVAQNLVLDKGPTLVLNADYNATEVPVPEGIGGSKTVVLAD